MQEKLLSEVLSEFAHTMVTDFPIQAILDQLVLRIVEVLPITGAGVTLISPGRDPHYIAASNEAALQFEQLQSELGEGPCLDAYKTGEAVAIPDLRTEARFPRFGPQASDAGLLAVFTFPLRHDDDQLGALDIYRDEPGPLDAADMAAAQTLADVAAAYLLNAQAKASLRDSSDRFRDSSLHDALTGLPNRALLRQRLDHAVLKAQRSHKMVAVLFVDLDRFKQVNDTYGHRAGDELLVALAERLTGLLRSGDTLARMAGDEFVILCEDLADAGQAEALAVRIDTALADPFQLTDEQLLMTASVGIAFAGRGVDIPEQVLANADAAMYEAKRRGGAGHHIIDLRERDGLAVRATLAGDLSGATSRGELRTVYQPIVRIADGRIAGAEALLRWEHPKRGLLVAGTVIPLADESGNLMEIGEWALERACHDRRSWGFDQGELPISVNVSAVEVMGPGFCDVVTSALRDNHLDPATLTLELNESVLLADFDRAWVVLDDLKALGVILALDDFGIGRSSLDYLKRFPIDIVKIDGELIAEIGQDRASAAIISAIIDLAHALALDVVAEGVENPAQQRALAAAGCDFAQGYHFARPMTADQLRVLVADQTAHRRRTPALASPPAPGSSSG